MNTFEIGKEYIPVKGQELPDEPQRLTVGMYGGDADFYSIKGIVETALAEMGIEDVEYVRANESDAFDEACAMHPGRSAVIIKNECVLGIMGEIHPEVQENYGLGVKAYIAKLNIPEMMKVVDEEISYKPLPKFPASTRDLSLICDDSVPVAELEKAIKNAAGKILEKVTLFDVYKGKQIADGKKSVSYSLTLRSHDGTLTDEQADNAVKKALKALSAVGAELRA